MLSGTRPAVYDEAVTGESSAASARAALLAPGGNYGPDGPLLMFGGKAAQRRGASLHPVTWDPGAADPHAMVFTRVGQAVAGLDGTGSLIILGKSLGTMAAPVAADRGVPAVWFTPLLTDPDVVAALRRATAPCLLVGGTGDDWWDGDVARSITPHVTEIEGADHGMFVPGPLAASAGVLGEVAAAVERFLDDIVWRS